MKKLIGKLKLPTFNTSSAAIIFVVLILSVLVYLKTAQADTPATSKSTSQSQINSVPQNIVSNAGWKYMAGVTVSPNTGLKIQPLSRVIVNQDGSGGQANPPVALTAPHLSVSGNFSINANIIGLGNGASLQLYAKAPIIYDEWRSEPPSLRLTLDNQKLLVNQWDGSRQAPIYSQTFNIVYNDIAFIKIDFIASNLRVSVNSTVVANIPMRNLISSKSLWFGFDAIRSPGWTLQGLTISGAVNITAAPVFVQNHSDPNAWRNLAATKHPGHYIGAAIALAPLQTNSTYRTLAIGQYNMWTTENELKAQFVHPQPSIYSFQEADALVDTALANGIAVHGHALVFGEANPAWMQKTPKTLLKQVMINHITAVMTHFKGRIKEWDVVNEPLNDEDVDPYVNGILGLKPNIWYQAMGTDYIATAFRTAHIADPNAKLYLNDYGLEADGDRWDALLLLVKNLKQQGVPINGIGFQAHVYNTGDEIDGAVLTKHIQTLAALGLTSRISELDVHGDNSSLQSNQYALIFKTCLSQPACTAVSMWGITDRYGSTTEVRSYPPAYGDDLPYDANIQPKPLVKVLTNLLKTSF